MFSFIHTSDWHLGKPFGQFEQDLRGRLREARHTIIKRVAMVAQETQAQVVLVAGDVWDSPEPTSALLRQSLDAMGSHEYLRWALLPGNHDLLREGGMWERLEASQHRPDNVYLLLREEPVEIEPEVFLLPAPCRRKNPGRDLTEWMDRAATPEGAIRIGVAHGSIRDFSAQPAHSSVIDPKRVEQARLDYMALGDWHGTLEAGDRCWYSGTPEPDRFRKNDPGNCLRVQIAGPGENPLIERVATNQFAWTHADIELLPGLDPEEKLRGRVSEDHDPRDTLLQLSLTGRASLEERAVWERILGELEPSLAFLHRDLTALDILYAAEDLDRIDRTGALRGAAEALHKDAMDSALSDAQRSVARDALNRLYSWSVEEESQA